MNINKNFLPILLALAVFFSEFNLCQVAEKLFKFIQTTDEGYINENYF